MAIAYYNEHDRDKAAWLRELIKAGIITDGEVDERSIEDVLPNDVAGFTRCHWFAGIGVWDYALRQAGWRDDLRTWTGSCPCQPFSSAGQRKGFADERHLWPAWFHLIRVCRPDVVFGEQTAKRHGFDWLDLVLSDLEAEAYAVGALGLPAGGFGAPHIRERIFFVASTAGKRSLSGSHGRIHRQAQSERTRDGQSQRSRDVGSLADSELSERRPQAEGRGDVINRTDAGRQEAPSRSGLDCSTDDLAGVAQGNTGGEGLEIGPLPDGRLGVIRIKGATITETGVVNGFWRDADAILCNDEDGWKWRLVEPGAFPLASRTAARILRLRGYGDSICAPVAEEFIRAYLELTT